MKKFIIRTLVGALYAILFLGSIYSGQLLGNTSVGVFMLTAFALFVAVGGTFEYFRIVAMQGACPNRPMGYSMVTLTVVAISLSVLTGVFDPFVYCVVFLPFLMLVSMPITAMAQLWRHSEQPFRDIAYTLLPVAYIAIPLGLMSWLHHGWNVLVMCVIMVWVNDSFAYIGGSLLGRHKMWYRHSPGKTWEGTAIGVVVTVAVALTVGPLFATKLSGTNTLQWFDWLVLGLIVGICGTLGDLVESMLKRSVGIKDSGKIMPEHGGFLDRFDSLLVSLPMVAAYLLLRLFLSCC